MSDDDDKSFSEELKEKAVAKLLASLKSKEAGQYQFSDDEADALKEVAYYWLGFQAFGRFASFIQKALIYVGWLAGLWIAWKANLLPAYLSGGK